ncbi:hypothetical protein JO379_000268 [Streptomyces syringium]|uniref:Uncharacterized protein n=1 Tax=Streptomyces syringium TaxID=76729 RepID=A0ABS4XWB0_9ACTN|nr:hypothetical protein [Streptomyces syringium]
MQPHLRITAQEAAPDRGAVATIQLARRRTQRKPPARFRALGPQHRTARFLGSRDRPPRQVRDLAVLPLAADVGRDIDQALYLASSHPHGPLATAARTRLALHITALAGPSQAFARHLPEGGRARDAALDTVRHARDLAALSDGGDPATVLRLLAHSAGRLWAYAIGSPHENWWSTCR